MWGHRRGGKVGRHGRRQQAEVEQHSGQRRLRGAAFARGVLRFVRWPVGVFSERCDGVLPVCLERCAGVCLLGRDVLFKGDVDPGVQPLRGRGTEVLLRGEQGEFWRARVGAADPFADFCHARLGNLVQRAVERPLRA